MTASNRCRKKCLSLRPLAARNAVKVVAVWLVSQVDKSVTCGNGSGLAKLVINASDAAPLMSLTSLRQHWKAAPAISPLLPSSLTATIVELRRSLSSPTASMQWYWWWRRRRRRPFTGTVIAVTAAHRARPSPVLVRAVDVRQVVKSFNTTIAVLCGILCCRSQWRFDWSLRQWANTQWRLFWVGWLIAAHSRAEAPCQTAGRTWTPWSCRTHLPPQPNYYDDSWNRVVEYTV